MHSIGRPVGDPFTHIYPPGAEITERGRERRKGSRQWEYGACHRPLFKMLHSPHKFHWPEGKERKSLSPREQDGASVCVLGALKEGRTGLRGSFPSHKYGLKRPGNPDWRVLGSAQEASAQNVERRHEGYMDPSKSLHRCCPETLNKTKLPFHSSLNWPSHLETISVATIAQSPGRGQLGGSYCTMALISERGVHLSQHTQAQTATSHPAGLLQRGDPC